MVHRDSVGNVEMIRAGDVNWMTAGRGIVHSERTPTRVLERALRDYQAGRMGTLQRSRAA